MAATVSFSRDDLDFVFRVVRRVVGATDAPDLAQEALLRAFRKRHQFRGEAHYRTWLYRIAVTTSLEHLRSRRGKHLIRVDERCAVDAVAEDPTPEQHVVANELRRQVRIGVEGLSPQLREIVVLRYRDGRSEEDVARELGISVANVKIRAFRARARLRQVLARG